MDKITIKQLQDEDFLNYKEPCMFIGFPHCSFKCEKECGIKCCQNSELAQAPNIKIGINTIVKRYVNNPITSAIVIGGLEPFDTEEDLFCLISALRESTQDDIIIYTGFKKEEVQYRNIYQELLKFKNIIIKFGRSIPNQPSHYDEILGIKLASDNQYAERIS